MFYTLEILIRFFLANAFTDLFCAYSKFSVKLSQGWRNRGGGRGSSARPPDFGRQINPISTRGGRLCTHINTGPLDFQTFLWSC